MGTQAGATRRLSAPFPFFSSPSAILVFVIWFGEQRGELSDWVTQRWVCSTGRRISLSEHPWLDGPAGNTRRIGSDFYQDYVVRENLKICEEGVRGLIPDFGCLQRGNPSLGAVAPEVRTFYEQTSTFELDVWSEWRGFFKPFGIALSRIFSVRLQQLNLPLSSLDTAKGMTSRVVQMTRPSSGVIVQTAWIRELRATRNVLYAGCYSVAIIPGHAGSCVKVVFPLPNGNAIVIMKAEANQQGHLVLQSFGRKFGDPGFYLTVHHGNGIASARYLRTFHEEIRVYPAETDCVRADHLLRIWGRDFLRLHYRMRC